MGFSLCTALINDTCCRDHLSGSQADRKACNPMLQWVWNALECVLEEGPSARENLVSRQVLREILCLRSVQHPGRLAEVRAG